jgi:hypothetical protein
LKFRVIKEAGPRASGRRSNVGNALPGVLALLLGTSSIEGMAFS